MRDLDTRKPSLVATSLALASFVTLLSLPSVAQQPRDPAAVFGDVIEVRVVNLEVVVTDKRGNRVTGLEPGDLLLEVDGTEVPIEYFTEIFGGRAVERPPAASVSTVPQLVSGEVVSTSYLVFIDEYFSRRVERDRVVLRMIEQLSHLGPEDRMAVVAFTGTRLDMLSSWTQSQSEMADVLERALSRPTQGALWQARLRIYEKYGELGEVEFRQDSPDLATEPSPDEHRAVMEVTHQVDRVVLGIASALRSFANPPGRKVMLLLSGGWPFDPVSFVCRPGIGLDYPHQTEVGRYSPLIDTANRLGYTLYTVDTPAIIPRGSAGSARTPGAVRTHGIRSFLRQVSLDSSLTELALRTGGRAFLNGREKDILAEVVADTRSYYWIGFTPSWKGDDEHHDIRVRVRQRGLKARTRESYSDLSRGTEVTMLTESSLLFGNPFDDPLLARLGKAEKSGLWRMIVPLSVTIPLSDLAFVPHDEGYVARTELRVAVLDEWGNTADVPVIPLPLALDELPEVGAVQQYDTAVRLRKQEHDVVVSLYDTTSGKIFSARLEVEPE